MCGCGGVAEADERVGVEGSENEVVELKSRLNYGKRCRRRRCVRGLEDA